MQMVAHKLLYKGFIDPRWMRQVQHGVNEVTVSENGLIELQGEQLHFATDDHGIVPGDQVRVWLSRDFYCEKLGDYNARLAEAEERKQEETAAWNAKRDALRDEATRFNQSLNVPVSWQTGYKDVLSGLSENSWGDGTNKATVGHIEFLEPYEHGRLKREKGEFLCSKNTGKQWSGNSHLQGVDGSGEPYNAKVTCRACIKSAQRWQNKG